VVGVAVNRRIARKVLVKITQETGYRLSTIRAACRRLMGDPDLGDEAEALVDYNPYRDPDHLFNKDG
jgi:DNA-binding transcriptional regulator PaaX